MKFFKMWWDKLPDFERDEVKMLIKEKRLNMINGGFSAPDEATTDADDLIDNFLAGHQFLKNEVGLSDDEIPTISW